MAWLKDSFGDVGLKQQTATAVGHRMLWGKAKRLFVWVNVLDENLGTQEQILGNGYLICI
jgi:hypothetical protein